MTQRGSGKHGAVVEGIGIQPLTTTDAIRRGKRLLAEAGKAHLSGDISGEFRSWSALLVLAAEQGKTLVEQCTF